MATITITRKLQFDAAHRVMQHESKCRNLHGHRYEVAATFTAKQGLDPLGRIIDFGVIKGKLGAWLDQNWDHATVLFEQDRMLGDAIAQATGQVIFYLPTNPTAENMAHYLLDIVCPQLFADTEVECSAIMLHETPNCAAYAGLDEPEIR